VENISKRDTSADSASLTLCCRLRVLQVAMLAVKRVGWTLALRLMERAVFTRLYGPKAVPAGATPTHP